VKVLNFGPKANISEFVPKSLAHHNSGLDNFSWAPAPGKVALGGIRKYDCCLSVWCVKDTCPSTTVLFHEILLA
jgi:hypothetical protein